MHRKERDHYEQKIIPTFESEAAEREFWENHDSGDYLDWSLAKTGHHAEPETDHAVHLPAVANPLREDIKVAANSRDVPYQSLIKIWLSEKIHEAL